MTVVTPYAGLPPRILIRNTLYWHSQNIGANPENGDYSYTMPDPFDDMSETDYNNITWTDARPQPSWPDIVAYHDNAWESSYPFFLGYTTEDVFRWRQDYWDQYMTEHFEDEVDDKQPHAAMLDVLSDMDISEHIQEMMETASKADARAHLEIDTMALEEAVNYYTKSATDSLLAGKASSSHAHVANDISNATTIGKAILTASNAAGVRSAIFSPATHINDSAINAPTDCPTNAPNDAPTNLNVITTLLGTLTNEVNATNTRQNSIANNCNSIATKVNTGFGILNTLAGKFNLSLDIYENNGLMAA